MMTTSGVAIVSYCFGICAMEDKPTDAGALGTEKCFICPDGGIGRRVCLKSRCLWRESSSLSLGTSGVSLIMLAMLNNQRKCSP